VHVYLHVPFCARRCSYCDFAIAVRREVPSRAYADLLVREWRGWLDHPAWRGSPALDTIYFGGGTPSRLDPAALATILAALASDRVVAPGAEVTLEVNPDDVSPAAARAWHEAGITRASLGAQSFDPAVLAWMHRTHRAEQVAVAVDELRSAGIAEVSLDLIFALPGELARDWRGDLDRALALAPDHLSLYGLTVEAHTPLAHWVARRETGPAPDDRYADEFLTAHERLGGAGYEHYEVSNYARPGKRARHNSAYWRRAPYIGLGPSAHSGLGRERRWNVREWAAYERRVGGGEGAVEGSELLDARALRLEELYLGLRTVDGVPQDRLPAPVVANWVDEGWGNRGPAPGFA
jgi:oxygen-independent coproporphyrinogen-3 oxidase